MAGVGIDAAVLVHPRDVFYYAGTVRPAVLVVTQQGVALLVRRGLIWAQREATVARVEPMDGLRHVADVLVDLGCHHGVLGVPLDVMPVQVYHRLARILDAGLQDGGGWTLADVSPLVLDQRAVKEEHEIDAVEQAAVVADVGQAAVPGTAAPGVTELQIAAEAEAAMRRVGHEGYQPLRYPEARGAGVLLMSGENLAIRGGHGLVVTGSGLGPAMPYGPSRRRLRRGDLLVLDVGATFAGYTADESRTYVVGPADRRQRGLFDVACNAEEAVIDLLRAGVTSDRLCAAAEAVVSAGAPPGLPRGSLVLTDFVGHGVGLEIDELPILWRRERAVVESGMVLAVEIEVSAPEPGLMVKLEDTVVVSQSGCRVVTRAPRELIECGT
jgi:Xaa-Pro aminopeptidase